jgi:hypothetical protein
VVTSDGHRVDHLPRGRDYGATHPHTHIPASGMYHSTPPQFEADPRQSRPHTEPESMRASQGRLPKIQFPVFTGEDPQLWRSCRENYFDMYGVEQQVRVTSMHLEGPATRWLQSAEHQLRCAGWDKFCVMVHDRFGRDQHEAQIRQLFHIRQSGTVTEYVEQFSELLDQLVAYESEGVTILSRWL